MGQPPRDVLLAGTPDPVKGKGKEEIEGVDFVGCTGEAPDGACEG